MSRVREFKLPDLGEGLTEGEILKWLVQPGDTVKINDPIVEVETAKAAVEVPSPYAGVVLELFHPEGATVDVGSPIISFDTEPGAGPVPPSGPEGAARAAVHAEFAGTAPPAEAEEPGEVIEEGKIGGKTSTGRTAVLVGYGIKETKAERRPRRTVDAPVTAAPPPPARVSAAVVASHVANVVGAEPVLAKPPVRKRARDLGVDLRALHGSGPGGVITRSDVEAAARVEPGEVVAAAPRRAAGQRGETRVPIKGVRKLTAAKMVASAFTAPHVTEFMTIDMTASMELIDKLRAMPEFDGIKVTPLTLVAKALVASVKRHPEVNCSWDEAAQEIVFKDYVNLGIAAATPRGLMVPNIKDADLLTLAELAQSLQSLAAVAKEGRTSPADMTGGTITITNVGVFGVDNGTPIINEGEAAILCFGAVRQMPWVVDGQIVPRWVTTLTLSFDHRMVDGALGSMVLADVGNALNDPLRLLAWS